MSADYAPGTVKPADRHDPYWCREGMAVAEKRADGTVFFADTYWGGGMDRHILTDAEIATADVLFHLDRFRLVERGETWDDFAEADRQLITSQHRLQNKKYVRIGAQPDHETKVENAQEKVREAIDAVESAKRSLHWAERDLAELSDEATS
jgi:hypothetical protein